MRERIQLSRATGWRMPENTVKVDRTTKWGNPLIVGKHGTREECVKWLALALNGFVIIHLGKDDDGVYMADKLVAYRKHVVRNRRHLVGKNLACWCRLPKPGEPDLCHAALLLEAASRYAAARETLTSRTGEINHE